MLDQCINICTVIFNDHLLYTEPYDIICYGIGSMQKSKNAQYQFELALILRELLKVLYTETLLNCQLLSNVFRLREKCTYSIQ